MKTYSLFCMSIYLYVYLILLCHTMLCTAKILNILKLFSTNPNITEISRGLHANSSYVQIRLDFSYFC